MAIDKDLLLPAATIAVALMREAKDKSDRNFASAQFQRAYNQLEAAIRQLEKDRTPSAPRRQ